MMPSLSLRLRLMFARPANVVVDLRRLDAAGGSGGVKPLLLHQVRAAAGLLRSWKWTLLSNPETADELRHFMRHRSCTVQVGCNGWLHDPLPRVAMPGTDVLFHPFPHWDEPALEAKSLVSLVVDTLHRDLPGALDEGSWERRERMLTTCLPKSRAVVVISEFVRGRVAACYGVPVDRLFVCPPVMPQAVGEIRGTSFAEAPPPPGSFLYYPANFWRHKNHRFLLEVRQATTGAFPLLVCAGEPAAEREAVKAQWAQAGLAEDIRVLPHQPEAMHRLLMETAKAVVFPSSYEGWGMPVVEALRAGVPVLRGACEALRESSLGLGEEPGDLPEAWAVALAHTRRTASPKHALARWKAWEQPMGLVHALLAARRTHS
jgi:glycosyltransferase involved in cell wall biosynthesis